MALIKLPAFYDMIYTKEDSRLTGEAYMFNDQTFQVLNHLVELINDLTSTVIQANDVTVNGLNPPSKTTAEINAIVAETDPDKQVKIGTIWYDSSIKKLKFLSDTGVVETITSA